MSNYVIMSILYTISEVIILKTIFFRHFFNIIFLSYFLGRCSNGTESVGCGPQEEFRACSDVSITTADGYADATINELGKEKLKVTKNVDFSLCGKHLFILPFP